MSTVRSLNLVQSSTGMTATSSHSHVVAPTHRFDCLPLSSVRLTFSPLIIVGMASWSPGGTLSSSRSPMTIARGLPELDTRNEPASSTGARDPPLMSRAGAASPASSSSLCASLDSSRGAAALPVDCFSVHVTTHSSPTSGRRPRGPSGPASTLTLTTLPSLQTSCGLSGVASGIGSCIGSSSSMPKPPMPGMPARKT